MGTLAWASRAHRRGWRFCTLAVAAVTASLLRLLLGAVGSAVLVCLRMKALCACNAGTAQHAGAMKHLNCVSNSKYLPVKTIEAAKDHALQVGNSCVPVVVQQIIWWHCRHAQTGNRKCNYCQQRLIWTLTGCNRAV